MKVVVNVCRQESQILYSLRCYYWTIERIAEPAKCMCSMQHYIYLHPTTRHTCSLPSAYVLFRLRHNDITPI